MEALDELVDEAYRLFSHYEMGNELGVCTACCVNELDAKLLKTLKPQAMSRELIFQFLDAAAEKGTPELMRQMKYLMPRILQLLLQGEFIRQSTEYTLDKCSCQHDAWSAVEVNFMQRFALAYFVKQFECYETADQVPDVLIMFQLAGLDVTLLLRTWLQLLEKPIAVWGVMSLIDQCDDTGHYHSPFAEPVFTNLIADWLAPADTREAIHNAIVKHLDVFLAADMAAGYCEKIVAWFSELK